MSQKPVVIANSGTSAAASEQHTTTQTALQMRKILVPIDFSACCRKALAYALPFARQFGAELILLHVVPPYPPIAEMGPVDVEELEDAKKDLENLTNTVSPTSSRSLLRVGNPVVEILETAKSLGIDLIILSTHGRSGLDHLLLGSTTEKVVRHAPCPVLVVREHEHDFVPETETEAKA